MSVGVEGFIPQRLTEAREANGINIIVLAEMLESSRQSVSAYEKGTQSPSREILDLLSKKLGMPKQYFLKPKSRQDKLRIIFRSFASSTKKERIRAERKLDWLLEIIEYLGLYVDFLPVKVPNIDISSDVENISSEEIEDIATACRRGWGLGDGPLSNVVRLLGNNGIIVTRREFESPKLDAFSTWAEDINIPIIFLNDDKRSAVRSRFNAAHELGHLIFHRSVKNISKSLKIIEKQADKFSSAFLLPAETFTADFGYPSLDTFRVIKERWKVSIRAMIMRCYDLGIIDEKQKTRLFITYTRKGWRKKEPMDDFILMEKPVFLRRCIELLVDKNIKTREDILWELSLVDSEVEKLTCLPNRYFRNDSPVIEKLPNLKNKRISKSGKKKGNLFQFPSKN
jgi:Zn-dependent peptidase ImmA (M78 family)/DNA-binding XRE family transcriptional regulator